MPTTVVALRQRDRDQEGSHEELRSGLAARLHNRRPQLDERIYSHVRDIALASTAGERGDDATGLRRAVSQVIDWALAGIECGERGRPGAPPAVVAQARRAAREGVRLDTVLRWHAASDRLLSEFILDDSERLPARALREIMRAQSSQVDHLLSVVAAEYRSEMEQCQESPTQRRARSVQRLLAGERASALDNDYQLDGWWHVGVNAIGADAQRTLRALQARSDRRLLRVMSNDSSEWAWLGSRRRVEAVEVEQLLTTATSRDVRVAIGEPGEGLDGWRQTHRQAQAAQDVALRRPPQITRFADVLLLFCVISDDTLGDSLEDVYLAPLASGRDRGAVSKATLRAYLKAGCNAATAAAALGVDRHTVERRLRAIEARLGRLIRSCHAELEVALRLDEHRRAPSAGCASAG